MQRIPHLLMLLILVLGAARPAEATDAERRVVSDSAPRLALVIGNANYTSVARLKNSANDARLIASKLRALGFDVTEALDRDRAAMSRDVSDFADRIRQRGRDTVSVVYYAGHGLEDRSVNYLVPVNAVIRKSDDIAPQSLSVKEIADRLSAAGNQLNILIIDACRDNPFPDSGPQLTSRGLVPMGAVYGVFIASSTGSGKAAFDGDGADSPYTLALADALTARGEKLEDVFKSVRRQVRLATREQQIPWESTAVEFDFYFVPPPPPVPPEQQLLAAANETGKLALYDLLIEKFPDSAEAAEARQHAADLRRTAAPPAQSSQSPAATVLERAKQVNAPEAYDLVVSLFPGTGEADIARAEAARLREVFALDSAGPTLEGRLLIQKIQEQLTRLACAQGLSDGAFDSAIVQGLRQASLLTDDRYLWYRPTMAALRALRKVDTKEGCAAHQLAAGPRCLRINDEDFCR